MSIEKYNWYIKYLEAENIDKEAGFKENALFILLQALMIFTPSQSAWLKGLLGNENSARITQIVNDKNTDKVQDISQIKPQHLSNIKPADMREVANSIKPQDLRQINKAIYKQPQTQQPTKYAPQQSKPKPKSPIRLNVADYYQGRNISHKHEFNQNVANNASKLINRINALLSEIPNEVKGNIGVRSGWRPPSYNAKIPGAAKRSAHMTGEAIDISDNGQKLAKYLLKHPQLLSKYDLRMENPSHTGSWCHLDIKPVGNNRIFNP